MKVESDWNRTNAKGHLLLTGMRGFDRDFVLRIEGMTFVDGDEVVDGALVWDDGAWHAEPDWSTQRPHEGYQLPVVLDAETREALDFDDETRYVHWWEH